MSKPFKFSECKICKRTPYDSNNYRTSLEFLVDGQFYCLSCLEKKGTNCRWCHKSVNLVHNFTHGKTLCVYDKNGNKVDTSSICCVDCLEKIEYEKDNWGHKVHIDSSRWKKCQTLNCRYIISRHEEAIGYDKLCRSCKHNEENQKWTKTNRGAEREWENYKQAHEKAQNYWNSLSNSERERECERLVENMKREKYWANNVKEGDASGWACDGSLWIIKNGKFTSCSPQLVPIQIVEEFMEKEIGFRDNLAIEWFDSQIVVKKNNNDNSPSGVNPTLSPNNSPSQLLPEKSSQQPTTSQPIREGNASGNSEKSLENSDKNGMKKVEVVNSEVENKPNANDNEVLVINLKEVKKIVLRDDGKLEIEFNSPENSNYTISQTITAEQVNSNQELQTIKNYCQKSGKSSLSQKDLNNIFSTRGTSGSTSKPTDNNNALTIGLSITAALTVVGLAIGLLLKRKKKVVKRS